ncbi:hypothetical protein Q6D67_18320 [Haliea sp. E1-2-M8]|uniref:hypothetical protein n=1 Tax=Haliea sp. E1-2-M8 TaxID=3064706 RepID=UPI00272318AC|nr:hypothetical protein [Haliea sp. E1-2-M8]MDO8863652.1 hypothetical protein [Haliea sp. E1-2-M8]
MTSENPSHRANHQEVDIQTLRHVAYIAIQRYQAPWQLARDINEGIFHEAA